MDNATMLILSRQVQPQSPKWLKGAVKLLESGFDGEDWRALADLLGYKTKKYLRISGALRMEASRCNHFSSLYVESRIWMTRCSRPGGCSRTGWPPPETPS